MSDLPAFFQSLAPPALPAVAQALVRTLEEEETGLARVHELIASDPALCAQVLRAAGRAAPDHPREFATLDAATMALGPAPLRALALAASLQAAGPVRPGLDRGVSWRPGLACAAYAQWLAGGIGLDGQQAWLAALMLHLGELLVAQAQTGALAPRPPAGQRWAHQQQLLGYTEGQVAAELAHRWHFPAAIVRGLNTACAPLAHLPLSQLGGVLHLASLLADMNVADPASVDALPPQVVGALDLKPDWLREHLPARDRFPDLPSP